jgi:hypothetical protein
VRVAELAQAGQEALRGRQVPALAQERLHQHGRHLVGAALLLHQQLELGQALRQHLLLVLGRGGAEAGLAHQLGVVRVWSEVHPAR